MARESNAIKETPADRAMKAAREASDRAHLAYVATLDPRERAALAPWSILTAA
jgi:hypothetical protein